MRQSGLAKSRRKKLHTALSLALFGCDASFALAEPSPALPAPASQTCRKIQTVGVPGVGDDGRATSLWLTDFSCATASDGVVSASAATEDDAPALKLSKRIGNPPSIAPGAIAGEPTSILAGLILNLVPRGEFALLSMPDGDFWLGTVDATSLGLFAPPTASRDFRGEKFVSLKAMGAAKFVFSERDLTLSTTLPPQVFARQQADTGVQPTIRKFSGNDDFSSILNYQIAAAGVQGNGKEPSAQLNTELATRWQGLLFRHASAYSRDEAVVRYARFETQLIYDDPGNLRRWTLGDSIAYSGTFGSTLPLGGLAVTKFYGFDPRFIRFPLAGFTTFATTPSEITVSYQGIPMLQRQVQPGPVDISNLYYYGGARALDVTIRDALGRVQTFNVPFYFTDEVLGKGIDEYSYQAGRLRINPGGDFDHYEQNAASAFYRKGLSDSFTMGARGEASATVANAGLLASLRGDTWGIVSGNFSYGGNREQGRYASASQAAYAYQTKEAGFRVSLSRIGNAYKTLGDINETALTSSTRIIRELRTNASYNVTGLGLLSLDVGKRRNAGGDETTQRTLSLSKSLGRGLVAFLTASDTSGIGAKREVFLNINWSLGANYNAAATVRASNGDGETYSTSFNKSIPNGPGVGYRIDTDSLRHGDASGDRVRAFTQMNAEVVQLRGEASVDRFRQTSSTRSYSADVSGAFTIAGGQVMASRPVPDSFAVVALAEPLAGIKVFQNNQLAGVTDSDGKLLLPALNAFQDNQITLDHRDFPLDYSFGTLNKSLYPPYRSGQFWQVDVYRSQTYNGSLRARIEGQMRAVPPGSGKLFIKGEVLTFLIGNNGEFFLERMVPGEYSGEIVVDSKTCGFKLVIPASKESYVKLGETVVCE